MGDTQTENVQSKNWTEFPAWYSSAIPVPSLTHCHHVAMGERYEKILNAANQLLHSGRTDLFIKYDFILVMQCSVPKILGSLQKYSLSLLLTEQLLNFSEWLLNTGLMLSNIILLSLQN